MERSDLSKNLSTFFGLLIVCLGLFLLERGNVLFGPRKAMTTVVIPMQAAFFQAGQDLVGGLKFFAFWKSGEMKIRHLEERVRELTVEAEKVKNLEAENRSLREQLGVPFSKGKKMNLCGVIGISYGFLLNCGSDDGIKEGMAAVYKDIFLGKISRVSASTSVVTVSSDPSSKITVASSKTRAKGIAVGQYGLGVIMEKVTQEEVLEKGDLVITTGEDGTFKGLIVGKVTEIKKEEAGLFQTAELDMLVDFSRLTQAFVILE